MTLPLDHCRTAFVLWATACGATYRLWLRLSLATALGRLAPSGPHHKPT